MHTLRLCAPYLHLDVALEATEHLKFPHWEDRTCVMVGSILYGVRVFVTPKWLLLVFSFDFLPTFQI